MEYIPKVLQAVAGEDFTIYLYFSRLCPAV